MYVQLVAMKRLSSFGFVPVSQSGQSSVEKRPRQSESPGDLPQPSRPELASSHVRDDRDLPQPPRSLPELPRPAVDLPQLSEASEPEIVTIPLSSEPSASEVPSVFVRNDVGTYSNDRLCKLSDEERLWLLSNAFRPGSSYKYPAKEEYGKKRTFQHAWLEEFPWLCYSQSCNGGFCVHCVLFA